MSPSELVARPPERPILDACEGPFLGKYGISSSLVDFKGNFSGQNQPVIDLETGEILGEGWSYSDALIKRYALQSQARRAMLEAWLRDGSQGKAHGVTRCRRWLRDRGPLDRPHAEVMRDQAIGRTFFAGTELCRSPWACPVCSAKIAERRAGEIRQAVDRWIGSGGFCLFVTLTVPHTRHDALKTLVDRFSRALELFRGGREASAINALLGRVGLIRALEVTWGELNGWHPHSHEIWFCRPTDYPESRIISLWQNAAVKAGFERPSLERGVIIKVAESSQQAAQRLAEYCTKLGIKSEDSRPLWGAAEELTKAHSKRGRLRRWTPWDFLRAQFDRDNNAASRIRYRELFAEYVQAFYRHRQIFWTRGLKGIFGVEDLTDEQVAEESRESADILARIEPEVWELLFYRGDHRGDHRANVLLLGQSGGAAAVEYFLNQL